jgi:predicted O-methyltransferase YrrM
MRRRVRDAVYGNSPYEDFALDEHSPDLQGWDSEHPIFEELLRSCRPRRILEVGTWKGASAIHMARLCQRHAIPCQEIVCVDTWLGGPDHILAPGSSSGQVRPSFYADDLRRSFGYPQIYYTFLRNVVDAGVQDLITPLALSSDAAFSVLHQLGYMADLIYLDASHTYESVRQDLDLYWRLLAPGGVFLGDDYAGEFPEVAQAVDEFTRANGMPLVVAGRKYLFEHALPAQPELIRKEAATDRRGGQAYPQREGLLSWEDVSVAPAFVINLERCPDRWTTSSEQVRQAGFTNVVCFLVFASHDPAALEAAWKQLGEPRFHLGDPDFTQLPGKQGCFLSHVLLWKTIVDDSIPVACIFEDDIAFHTLWPVLAPAYLGATPPDFHVLFMGAHIMSSTLAFVQRQPTFNLNAYVITLEGARLLYDRILLAPDGVYTIDVMINQIQEEVLARGDERDDTSLAWFVWNGAPFPDPKAAEAAWFDDRNMGLVFQDWTKGSTVDDRSWTT